MRLNMQPDFSKNNGLLSVILQDYDTGQVLMNGFMNEEAYDLTIRDQVVWFYSRSRQALWKKGETSGNYQHVVSMCLDCDQDALLIRVKPDGPTCHLGNVSCFDDYYFTLEILEKTIQDRMENPQEGSYTKYLIEQGVDKILKKTGEEMTEILIAVKNNDKAEIINEAGDLLYHFILLLNQNGVILAEVKDNLAERHGLKQKYKQRKEIEQW
ncbi:MAG TPA: bifunctional phosphoribosyl-AMP cyclohydrolase/phosphoribosyl-ATP diphosphatase HisIE [Clostridiaceae bacterium]|nr:bifunctional phosphoribosyl-AMP cyclohydrolase/phosphoribosyl-ATP diphosphatase HisIE [Clostridiaceae bacterium]